MTLKKTERDHVITFLRSVKNVPKWAGVSCVVGVYDQFAGLLSQEALAALEEARKQQGLVPDFLLQGQVQGIAELKTISSVPSHYPRTTQGVNVDVRPVDVRAGKIQGEYDKKLGDADPSGRALARLHGHGPVRGLVVGGYGEFSEDLHRLMNDLMEAKIPGTPQTTGAARGTALPWARRQIAVADFKARAELIVNGLSWCGPGGKEAYARRHQGLAVDREATAQVCAADWAYLHRRHGHDWILHAVGGGAG